MLPKGALCVFDTRRRRLAAIDSLVHGRRWLYWLAIGPHAFIPAFCEQLVSLLNHRISPGSGLYGLGRQDCRHRACFSELFFQGFPVASRQRRGVILRSHCSNLWPTSFQLECCPRSGRRSLSGSPARSYRWQVTRSTCRAIPDNRRCWIGMPDLVATRGSAKAESQYTGGISASGPGQRASGGRAAAVLNR
jgi:hypothetical protein